MREHKGLGRSRASRFNKADKELQKSFKPISPFHLGKMMKAHSLPHPKAIVKDKKTVVYTRNIKREFGKRGTGHVRRMMVKAWRNDFRKWFKKEV